MQVTVKDIYIGPDFLVQGEMAGGLLFIHCQVLERNITTYRKIKQMISDVKKEAKEKYGYEEPLYTYCRNKKWCRLMGGVYIDSLQHEGESYGVFEWS